MDSNLDDTWFEEAYNEANQTFMEPTISWTNIQRLIILKAKNLKLENSYPRTLSPMTKVSSKTFSKKTPKISKFI